MSPAITPYSSKMHRDLIQEVAGFLNWQTSLTVYSHLNREHRAAISAGGLPASITVPSILIAQLFNHIRLFTKLHTLQVDYWCDAFLFHPLELPHGTGKIERLFYRQVGHGGCSLMTSDLMKLVEAIPNLKEVGVANGRPSSQVQMGEEMPLSNSVRLNLANLTRLVTVNADSAGLLEILSGSSSFRNVRIEGQRISNAMLSRLVCNSDLSHLALTNNWGEELNYGVLAACTTLESLTINKLTENELILIIEANIKLKSVDLTGCSSEIVTDQVLQTIGRFIPGILCLRLPSEASITDDGLKFFLQSCTNLTELRLSLLNESKISQSSLGELRNCIRLKTLCLNSINLTDGFFTALANIRGLTSLDLTQCWGFTVAGLHEIHVLTHLEYLNLNKVYILTDALVASFIDNYPKLEFLGVSYVFTLTAANLDSIRVALRENRSALRRVNWTRPCFDFQAVREEFHGSREEYIEQDNDFAELVYQLEREFSFLKITIDRLIK